MNARTMLYSSRAGPLAALLALSLMGLAPAQGAPSRVVLPAGTVIPVRLDQSLSSKTARVGNTFSATVRYGKDDSGMPEGTRVEGVISEVVRAANGKPGVLDMNFRRMVTEGGQRLSLMGSLVSLDASSVKESASGRLVASSDKSKDRLKWVGIGAGAGLLAGVLTKGNKLIDILLGAGAGYAYNEFGNNAKPGDVNLKAGAEFGIRLDRQFAFQTNRTGNYDAFTDAREYDNRDSSNRQYDARDSSYSDRNNRWQRTRRGRDDIGMTVDGRAVSFGDAKPYIENGVSYFPLEPVARTANFSYKYSSLDQMIDARDGTMRMGIDSRDAVFDGERRRLGAAPTMRYGQVYVPTEFIGMTTGGSSDWDADSRTVVLTTQRDDARPYNRDIGMTVDNRDVSFGSEKPFMRGAYVMVPLRTMSQAAGFNIRWDGGQRLIYARNGNLRTTVGQRFAVLNGQQRSLGAASEMRNGTLYVPLEFINMATGGTSDWDAGSHTGAVTTRRDSVRN